MLLDPYMLVFLSRHLSIIQTYKHKSNDTDRCHEPISTRPRLATMEMQKTQVSNLKPSDCSRDKLSIQVAGGRFGEIREDNNYNCTPAVNLIYEQDEKRAEETEAAELRISMPKTLTFQYSSPGTEIVC